jgi:hypothetical protein
MIIPHSHPGDWQQFLKRKDNVGLSINEAKQKYLTEQLQFENFQSQQLAMLRGRAGGGLNLRRLLLHFGSDYFDELPSPVTLYREPYEYNGSRVWYGEGITDGELNYFFLFFSVDPADNFYPVNKWQVIWNDAFPIERSPAGITAEITSGQFYDDPEGGEPGVTPNNRSNPLGVYQNFEEAAWAVTLPNVTRAASGAT